jgi:glutathione synthase/RimK-type ligase-like ATP-grasp enzyme
MPRAADARSVLVLTNLRDLAADDVIRRLDAAGVEVLRMNADDCAREPLPTWSLDSENHAGIGAVWWRQFEIPAEGSPFADPVDELAVVRAQWRAWLTTLARPDIPWVNDLWAARRAEDKITQLRTARSIGFALPETIITNDPRAAADFADRRNAVVKTLAAAYFETSQNGFVYTTALEGALEIPSEAWYAQPVVVQQRVSGVDIRVVALAGRCFGASCETDVLDWRTAGTGARWTQWEVPGPLATLCHQYLRALNLRYAAFDFVLDGERLWFLEANQAGEWVFIDRSLGLGIVQALTSLLVDLAAGAP